MPSPESFWTFAPAANGIVNSAAAVPIKAAPGTSMRNYISALQVSWATLGAITELAIRDGAGGTVLWRMTLPTVAGSIIVPLPVPIPGSLGTLLEVVTLTAVTGGVYVNAQGFVGS